jgi:histidinol-phosphate aminotransferase
VEAALRRAPDCPVAEALAAAPLRTADIEVSREALRAALAALPPALRDALETARGRLRETLAPAVGRTRTRRDAWGNRVELRCVPLERVGVFVPGGRAPYPSSVLMAAVPARLAGVGEVILCTPAAPDGGADPVVLAAAALAGVDRVFLLGPVPAVAAMAWGISPLPAVDKVVGPGGAYLVEAKRQLFGEVGLDGLPGPSEIVILASADADPAFVAADLAAQAEHGPDGLAVLITDDGALAARVAAHLGEVLAGLPPRRRADALATLRRSGGPRLVADLRRGLALAEALAPEHLSLQGAGAEALAAEVRRAGALFVGPWAPVAAGDYAAGTSHVLPTAGSARFASALLPQEFMRTVEVFVGTADGVNAWAGAAAALAEAEGFMAHAASLRLRRAAAPPRDPEPTARAPYVPAVPPGAARLDLNENPFPWPEPLWGAVLQRLRAAEPSRYPRETERLQQALAAYAGVPHEWCLPGNGSDELLTAALAAWGQRAARVAFPAPTFGMYGRLAGANGLPAVAVPLGAAPGFELPVEALLAEAAQGGDTLLFLCRPNNPTGNLWPAAAVRRLVEAEGIWTVIDEAYIEFAGEEGLVSWLEAFPRLVVLRTLSKAFAFAGLRVGYALGRPDALAPWREAVQPWSVGAFACAAALEVLQRVDWMRTNVAALVAERERLQGALAALPGITPYRSCTNFILFAVGPASGWDAFALFDALYAAGVVLRRWPQEPRLRQALRVSVGRPEENDRFLEVLGGLLRQRAAAGA